TRRATRHESILVLPVPAPATTRSGPPSCSTAASWAGLRSWSHPNMCSETSPRRQLRGRPREIHPLPRPADREGVPRGMVAAGPEEFPNLVGGEDPQESVVARAAGDEAAARIVALLPKAQAEVVLLRVVAGLSVGEVAAMLGWSTNKVSVTQHRALRTLAHK